MESFAYILELQYGAFIRAGERQMDRWKGRKAIEMVDDPKQKQKHYKIFL